MLQVGLLLSVLCLAYASPPPDIDFQNELFGELDVECPPNQAISRVQSYYSCESGDNMRKKRHNGQHCDRQWAGSCKYVSGHFKLSLKTNIYAVCVL